jgi:hypothetical protein
MKDEYLLLCNSGSKHIHKHPCQQAYFANASLFTT